MSPSDNTNRNGNGNATSNGTNVEKDLLEQLRIFLSAISLSEDQLTAFFMTIFPNATNTEEICNALSALLTKAQKEKKCKHLERVLSYLPKASDSDEGYHSGEYTDSTVSANTDQALPPPARKRRLDDNSAANVAQPHLVLNEQYLFLKAVEGTTYYSCIDLRRRVRLICRPSENPCDDLIQRSDLMKHHHRINHIVEIVRRPAKTYIFYAQPGEDLLTYVRQKQKLGEDESRKIFTQIVEIVQDCHAQGIILRDLKMRKFFFTDNEKTSIKLESLEDAVTLENKDVDILEQRRGCPVYIAPEILKVNETYQGKPSDVWSLGVILYTLVAGRYPFNEVEHAQLFAKIAAADYTLPTNITPTLGRLLTSMLAKDPKDRIKSTDILRHSWFGVDKEVYLPESDDQCVPDSAAVRLTAGSPIENF